MHGVRQCASPRPSAWLEGLIDLERRRTRGACASRSSRSGRCWPALGDPRARAPRRCTSPARRARARTALLAEALLRAARQRTGTFTSPHLERWTERFRIDGVEVEGDALAAAIAALRPHVEALLARSPSRAELLRRHHRGGVPDLRRGRVDVRARSRSASAGRLDSTNVVEPAVCCITSIELEHTDKLGDTLAAIAGEKAGILKPGVPLVCGALPPRRRAWWRRVRTRWAARCCGWAASSKRSSLEEDLFGSRLRFRDGSFRAELRLSAPGRHQVANAALALAAVRRLGLVGDAQLAAIAEHALANVRLPGRIEICSRAPLDRRGRRPHRGVGARARRVLRRLPRRRSHLVLSVSAGKDVDAICAALVPRSGRRHRHARRAAALARSEARGRGREARPRAGRGAASCRIRTSRCALRARRWRPEDLLCATGSFYLAGIARRVLREPYASAESRTPGPAPRVYGEGGVAGPGAVTWLERLDQSKARASSGCARAAPLRSPTDPCRNRECASRTCRRLSGGVVAATRPAAPHGAVTQFASLAAAGRPRAAALASADRCAGVVPQQPPTAPAPAAIQRARVRSEALGRGSPRCA